jgi:transposase
VGKHAKTYADNDMMAAARTALVYLAGNAPCVWVPDALTCERRELLHACQKAVADHTAATNSLKGYLNQFAIHQFAIHQFAIRLGSRHLGRILRGPRRPGPTPQTAPTPHRSTSLRRAADAALHETAWHRHDQRLALLSVIGDVRRFQRPEKLSRHDPLAAAQDRRFDHRQHRASPISSHGV